MDNRKRCKHGEHSWCAPCIIARVRVDELKAEIEAIEARMATLHAEIDANEAEMRRTRDLMRVVQVSYLLNMRKAPVVA